VSRALQLRWPVLIGPTAARFSLLPLPSSSFCFCFSFPAPHTHASPHHLYLHRVPRGTPATRAGKARRIGSWCSLARLADGALPCLTFHGEAWPPRRLQRDQPPQKQRPRHHTRLHRAITTRRSCGPCGGSSGTPTRCCRRAWMRGRRN